MSELPSLRLLGLLVGLEWRLQRRDASAIVTYTVMPLALMSFMMPVYEQATDGRGPEHAVPGFTVMFSMFLLSHVGLVFFRDHGWNTWSRLVTAGVPPAVLVCGKLVVPFAVLVAQILFLLAVGSTAFGVEVVGNLAALVAVVAVYGLDVVCLGVVLVALCRTMLQLAVAANVLALVFAAWGGALVPVDLLPSWAAPFAPAIPSFWAMRAMETLIVDGGSWSAVGLDVAVLAAFAIVLALTGALTVRVGSTKESWA